MKIIKFIKDLILAVVIFFWGGAIIIAFNDVANEIFNGKLHLDFSPRLCGIVGIIVGGITVAFTVYGYRAFTKEVPSLKDEISDLKTKIWRYEKELEQFKSEN